MATRDAPTEISVLLAAAAIKTFSGWFWADQLAFQLERMGFGSITSQSIGVRLALLSKERHPLVLRRRLSSGPYEYRLTSYAGNVLNNRGWKLDYRGWPVPPAPVNGETNG